MKQKILMALVEMVWVMAICMLAVMVIWWWRDIVPTKLLLELGGILVQVITTIGMGLWLIRTVNHE